MIVLFLSQSIANINTRFDMCVDRFIDFFAFMSFYCVWNLFIFFIWWRYSTTWNESPLVIVTFIYSHRMRKKRTLITNKSTALPIIKRVCICVSIELAFLIHINGFAVFIKHLNFDTTVFSNISFDLLSSCLHRIFSLGGLAKLYETKISNRACVRNKNDVCLCVCEWYARVLASFDQDKYCILYRHFASELNYVIFGLGWLKMS